MQTHHHGYSDAIRTEFVRGFLTAPNPISLLNSDILYIIKMKKIGKNCAAHQRFTARKTTIIPAGVMPGMRDRAAMFSGRVRFNFSTNSPVNPGSFV